MPPAQEEDERAPLLLRRRRQFRHQTQRNRELIQLEMGPEESNGAVHAGLSCNLAHLDPSFAQRALGFGRGDAESSGVTYRVIQRFRNRSASSRDMKLPILSRIIAFR